MSKYWREHQATTKTQMGWNTKPLHNSNGLEYQATIKTQMGLRAKTWNRTARQGQIKGNKGYVHFYRKVTFKSLVAARCMLVISTSWSSSALPNRRWKYLQNECWWVQNKLIIMKNERRIQSVDSNLIRMKDGIFARRDIFFQRFAGEKIIITPTQHLNVGVW